MRYCHECSTELHPRNRSGYCRRHISGANAANPEWAERQRAGVRRKIASDPAYADDLRRRATEASKRNDPEKLRERWTANRYWERGNADRPAGHPSRIQTGRSLSAYRLADIPPHLREDYRRLTAVQHFTAAEARAIIFDQHEAEMRRWRREVQA